MLLVRHGQVLPNVRGEVATRAPGPALTPLGEQQAAALPAAFEHRTIDAIFVSSLLRTHLTAAPLAAARRLRPTELSGLREIEAGDLEDRSDPPAIAEYHGTFGAWASGDNSPRIPGGPDGFTFFEKSLEIAREKGYPFLQAETLLEYASMRAQNGGVEEAVAYLERASELLRELGAVGELARAQAALAALKNGLAPEPTLADATLLADVDESPFAAAAD